MHVHLDLCTAVGGMTCIWSFIGGHVSAQGAETLAWVIFKKLRFLSGSINVVFDLAAVDVD